MSQTLTNPSRIERPLGRTTARGFAWSAGQLLAVKVVNFSGQVILSWILLTKDYGFVSEALTIATFTALVQQAGIRDVLVQRGPRFGLWSGPAFVLSLFTGTLGAVLLAAAAPLASKFYHEPRLTGLILVLAVGGFVNCLTLVPYAKLQVDLRFRFMACLSLLAACFTMGTSVLLALLGCGAYSFVIPIPLTGLLYLAILWPLVRPPMGLRRSLGRIRYLFGDNLLLLGVTFFLNITAQGDNIILGRMFSKETVGLYYWAYNLSLQSLYLFADSTASVLFPSLSRLKAEPARLRDGFRRAARAIAFLGVPACLAQAALAGPAVHLVFQSQWYPAIPILQVLSIGMAFQVVGLPAISTMKAQGRFRSLLLLTGGYALLFVAMVYAGGRHGAALGVAIAVTGYFFVSALCSTVLTLHPSPRPWRDLSDIFAVPLAAGAVAGACAYATVHLIAPSSRPQSALALLAGGAVMLLVYVPLARLLARDTWTDVLERVRGLLGKQPPAQSDIATPHAGPSIGGSLGP